MMAGEGSDAGPSEGESEVGSLTARIEELATQIAHHSHLYYNLAAPEITDAEFDELWDELKRISPQHPTTQQSRC